MENPERQAQEQRLELVLKQQEQLEAEELDKLVGKGILFDVGEMSSAPIYGILKTVGRNYIFVENARILKEYDIKEYLQGRYSIETKTEVEIKLGVYNKKGISKLYPFDNQSQGGPRENE